MGNVRSMLILIAAFSLASVSAWAAGTPSATCSAPNAGLQIMAFGTMNLAVWYPTSAAESPYTYSSNMSGAVALNGAVSTCAKYPLLVFSHGEGGCGTQSVFLTEQLARSGFIVAAPDHADAGCSVTSSTGSLSFGATNPPFTNPSAWNNQTYYNRYVDNENTINGMLAHPVYGPQIDATRIAMSGHSLGGYDTFAMIGGWSNWYDARVKVGLMLSPYIQPFEVAVPSTVPNAHVPQMYQGGTKDLGITPFIMQTGGQYDQAQTPKLFAELQGAGHFDFTNLVCISASAPTVQTCLATVTNAVNIVQYSLDFLNFYLNNQTVTTLWGTGKGLATYWRNVPAAGVSSASYKVGGSLSANEITALFGQGMANSVIAAPVPTVPTSLGGTSVAITDSLGVARQCGLFFVAPTQVNFLIPQGMAAGTAAVTVTLAGSVVATGQVTIAAVAPSIFAIDGSGSGLVAAYVQTPPTYGASLVYNPATLAPVPVDVSSGGVYMVMAGTGVSAGTASAAKASIGGTNVPVAAIVPYPPFNGLDAIVLGPIPASLAGAGQQTISFSVGGVSANATTITIQ